MINEGAAGAGVPVKGPSSRALVAATAALVVVTSGATAFVALSGTSGLVGAPPGASPAAAVQPSTGALPVVVLQHDAPGAAPARSASTVRRGRTFAQTYGQARPATRSTSGAQVGRVDEDEPNRVEPSRKRGKQRREEVRVRGDDRAAAGRRPSGDDRRTREDRQVRDHPGRGGRHRSEVD